MNVYNILWNEEFPYPATNAFFFYYSFYNSVVSPAFVFFHLTLVSQVINGADETSN